MDRRTILVGAATTAASIISPANAAPLLPVPNKNQPGEKTMSAKGAVALVTGSNRGIGLGFVKVLLERGAKRVYATARKTVLSDT